MNTVYRTKRAEKSLTHRAVCFVLFVFNCLSCSGRIYMTIKVDIKKIFDKAFLPMKSVADVLIDDSIVIHSVALMEKKGKKYVSMPRFKRVSNGEEFRRDVVHPVNSSVRQLITTEVIKAYDEACKSSKLNFTEDM